MKQKKMYETKKKCMKQRKREENNIILFHK